MKVSKEELIIALKDLASWNKEKVPSSACGSACGASDTVEKTSSACGASDK